MDQPPPPVAPWPQPVYYQAPYEPNAVTALVLGILGIAVCGVVAPFAWSIGKKSLDNIQRNPGRFSGEGMAKTGHILGIVGTVLLIVTVVFMIFWFTLMASMFSQFPRP